MFSRIVRRNNALEELSRNVFAVSAYLASRGACSPSGRLGQAAVAQLLVDSDVGSTSLPCPGKQQGKDLPLHRESTASKLQDDPCKRVHIHIHCRRSRTAAEAPP